jgi:hypothetical protein
MPSRRSLFDSEPPNNNQNAGLSDRPHNPFSRRNVIGGPPPMPKMNSKSSATTSTDWLLPLRYSKWRPCPRDQTASYLMRAHALMGAAHPPPHHSLLLRCLLQPHLLLACPSLTETISMLILTLLRWICVSRGPRWGPNVFPTSAHSPACPTDSSAGGAQRCARGTTSTRFLTARSRKR